MFENERTMKHLHMAAKNKVNLAVGKFLNIFSERYRPSMTTLLCYIYSAGVNTWAVQNK